MRHIVVAAALLIAPLSSTAAGQSLPEVRDRVEALEQQVAILEQQMAGLIPQFIALRQRVDNAHQHQTLTVDCTAGQTVNSALAQAAGRSNPVTIRITGMCVEAVILSRDDVQLRGAAAGAGIEAPPGGHPLNISGTRVSVSDLTIRGGLGLAVVGGGVVNASNVRVTGAQTGLNVTVNSSLVISNSVIEENDSGALVGRFGFLWARGMTFRNNASGLSLVDGTVILGDSTVAGGGSGFGIQSTGHLRLSGVAVLDHQIGIRVTGGSFNVGGGSIANNSQTGVHLSGGGSAVLDGGLVIEGNGSGVSASAGSSLSINAVTIRNNSGDGIRLTDVSVLATLDATPVTRIHNNTGWGIVCGGPPAVAHISDSRPGWPFDATHVYGNTAGQIGCPGASVP